MRYVYLILLGAFSTVYKVINKETNVSYAVKQIIKKKLSKEDEVGLQQEVEILQSMDHKHIVKFIDFFDEPDYYYVVLELLEGMFYFVYCSFVLGFFFAIFDYMLL